MKKLLSVLLAVALLASLTCISVSAAPTAVDKTSDFSLLPSDASGFSKIEGKDAGDGTITVSKDGDSFVFKSGAGWPSAYTTDASAAPATADKAPASWASVDLTSEGDIYVNYDFEVKSGATKVIVYLCGQSPVGMAGAGSFIDLNCFILKHYDVSTGQTPKDVGVGKYQGSIKLSTLYEDVDPKNHPYIDPGLAVDDATNISGVKVYAVAGETVVNDISLGKKKYDETSMATKELNLLTNGSTNGANGESEVTFKDGVYEVKVTKAAEKNAENQLLAYGMQIATGLKDFNLGATTYLQIAIDSDTPWRLTTNDAEISKWFGLKDNFGKLCDKEADADGFYPAGNYEIAVDYGSIYTWNANNGASEFDVTSACLDGVYIEAKDPGTIKVKTVKLSESATFSITKGTNTGEAAGNDDVQGGDNNNNNNNNNNNDATTKKTTTTAKKTGTDDNADNVETGDVSSAVLFAVIAVIALAVVTLSAKVKAR